MKQLKVSASYWNGLSAKEQMVFTIVANKEDIPYAKRIITLARKYFPNYEKIVPLDRYVDDERKAVLSRVWVVVYDGEKMGTIWKTRGIGMTEKVSRFDGNKMCTIWHN